MWQSLLKKTFTVTLFFAVFFSVKQIQKVEAQSSPTICSMSITSSGTGENKTLVISLRIFPSSGETEAEQAASLEQILDSSPQLSASYTSDAGRLNLIPNTTVLMESCGAVADEPLTICNYTRIVPIGTSIDGESVQAILSSRSDPACQASYTVPEDSDPTEPVRENFGQGEGLEVNRQTLNALNPLRQLGNESETGPLNTPGAILSRFLTSFAFPIAGLILFVMLIWGGFEILSGASTKKSMDAGKQRIQAALIGFLLLFVSYWIAQLIEYVFGVTIV